MDRSLDELFSPDFGTARQRFRSAATQLGWHLESHPISACGPGGEELTIDVARSSLTPSRDTLIISSGLHGVEGFFGSAVQLGLMTKWVTESFPPEPFNIVFLHALNPFGFAHGRRFNEQNIDLNRNFRLPGVPFEGCPELYPAIDSLINPARPPGWRDAFYFPRALCAMMRYDRLKLREAVASGQCEFPKGIFYGGAGPSQTSEIISSHLRHWVNGSKRVLHLDFHTGLGPWATWKLITGYATSPVQAERLNQWFESENFDEIPYQMIGDIGKWCIDALFEEVDYTYACAEFGTYSDLKISDALRLENQAHHWCAADAGVLARARHNLIEMFCPRDREWRQAVLDESYGLVAAAIGNLKRDSRILSATERAHPVSESKGTVV